MSRGKSRKIRVATFAPPSLLECQGWTAPQILQFSIQTTFVTVPNISDFPSPPLPFDSSASTLFLPCTYFRLWPWPSIKYTCFFPVSLLAWFISCGVASALQKTKSNTLLTASESCWPRTHHHSMLLLVLVFAKPLAAASPSKGQCGQLPPVQTMVVPVRLASR